jgi:adenine-specific DNA-methyltransferase
VKAATAAIYELPRRPVLRVVETPPVALPERACLYPELRYMGSKRRLLPWIHQHLHKLDFETVADPFVGSGCVAYLLKSMGKRVLASDFLNFPATLAAATIANSHRHLDGPVIKKLLRPVKNGPKFIEETFTGVFYERADLRFLDRVAHNIETITDPQQQALARAALIRSCLKKHFLEQIEEFNRVVFDNGRRHTAKRADVFALRPRGVDLVYLDPPYVPRADDNCYIKRYHFLEGLSCYWRGLEIMQETKVKKIPKLFTPFSYRRTAHDAFDRLFHTFRESKIVLSYSSNGFPGLDELREILSRYKRRIDVFERHHRYHFGTHENVQRAEVQEYLIVGQ